MTDLPGIVSVRRDLAIGRDWDLVGVGDIDVDLCLRVDHLPGHDEKVGAELLGEFPGGMVSNVCCAASRLGMTTAMMGIVGTDRYGEMAVSGLREFGVDDSLVVVVQGGRTFFCVALLDGSGEKALTVVDTDCHLPNRDDIDPAAFARTTLVHLIGDDMDFVEWAAHEARARGALVSIDMEVSTTARGSAALAPMLRNVDVAFLNEAGYRQGFGDDPRSALESVLALGPRIGVITRGPAGALVGDGSELHEVPARPVQVVDSTGAGDAFIGAFLSQLWTTTNLRGCTEFAVGAAGLALGGPGSRSALPTTDEVMRSMSGAHTVSPERIPL